MEATPQTAEHPPLGSHPGPDPVMYSLMWAAVQRSHVAQTLVLPVPPAPREQAQQVVPERGPLPVLSLVIKVHLGPQTLGCPVGPPPAWLLALVAGRQVGPSPAWLLALVAGRQVGPSPAWLLALVARR
jgi:hypothetical protein